MGDFTTGSCLCESVRFEISGSISKVYFCHCKQCRTWGGHFAAAAAVNKSQLNFSTSDSLKWFSSSEMAQRGFCEDCGSSLFWKEKGSSRIFIWVGTISDLADLKPAAHMYTKDAGNYYSIPNDCEHFEHEVP